MREILDSRKKLPIWKAALAGVAGGISIRLAANGVRNLVEGHAELVDSLSKLRDRMDSLSSVLSAPSNPTANEGRRNYYENRNYAENENKDYLSMSKPIDFPEPRPTPIPTYTTTESPIPPTSMTNTKEVHPTPIPPRATETPRP